MSAEDAAAEGVRPREYLINEMAFALLGAADVDVQAVLDSVGMTSEQLLERPRLSADRFHTMWRTAITSHQGDLVLELLTSLTFDVFSPPLFAASCSPNLNVAAQRIAEHKPLIGPTTLSVDVAPSTTTVTIRWPNQMQPPASLGLFELLFWVALARLGTGRRIMPIGIGLPTIPSNLDDYFEYLGTSPQRSDEYWIRFSAADAASPFVNGGGNAVWEMFAPELRRQLDELDKDATVTDRVRAALIEELPLGRSSIGEIAHRLSVSTRTLQRRLSNAGTTYGTVLADARLALAEHYLHETDLLIEEIAFLVGYGDHHSFHRSFLEWTGTTPGARRSEFSLDA